MTSREKVGSDYRKRVYKIVRMIPRGSVMTYGQLAEILGDGYTPRTVGFVMHAADEGTPWHRVINARGECSTTKVVLPHDKQQRMLEAEGVKFDKRGRCNLEDYLWIPDDNLSKIERPRSKTTLFRGRNTAKKDKI